jgi:ArsR family transcriptional regulator, arsenate/arsenite/antimonite-responsive transcriptional repressor
MRLLTERGLLDSYLTMRTEQPGTDTRNDAQAVRLTNGQFERIAKALADPRRFKVLQMIAEAEHQCAYQKLCSEFPVTKATISHHLKELVTAGLVETERDGQFVHTRVVPGVIEAYSAELLRRMGPGGERQ